MVPKKLNKFGQEKKLDSRVEGSPPARGDKQWQQYNGDRILTP